MGRCIQRRTSTTTVPSRPHVALLIETSLASGRDILSGVARYVREHHPWSLYHEPHALEDAAPRWLRRWHGDGIIARIQTPRMAKIIFASGLPAVDVLGVVPRLPFPLVHVDNFAVARVAAEHLMERGLRQFGYFGIARENWSQQRFAGFCTAVAQVPGRVSMYELPRDLSGTRSWEHDQNRLATWIHQLPKPVGVLVGSDQRGPRFLEACRRAGVAVPDEVAVIGVDNDGPLCEVCDPPLSSIDPGHTAVGYQAAAVLDELMRGTANGKRPLLIEPQQVVARLSTDTLAIGNLVVARALQLIREHAHEGLSVDTIARSVGVSRSVLQRRFRALLKRSVHEEILSAKIKFARGLLTKTDLALAIIAERSGFKHQEYMGAVFKKRVGRTPGRVREGGAVTL
jgi:LacI family transcriptional regulator